ncbi:MAG: hypothetical protein ACLTNP_04830 [Streptococcus salivarius]
MRERAVVKSRNFRTLIATFHSMCVRILHEADHIGYNRNFTIRSRRTTYFDETYSQESEFRS